ncbi:DUF732 domain-containing protein [Streptomyces sp. NPDC002889]|uniref:DUF732 domain-containing protein n=1 Tax=Streptomyces sp. NPDC002889 TaxID=3364669 RepID=UPI00369F81FF
MTKNTRLTSVITLMGIRRNRAVWIAAVGALLAGSTACGGGESAGSGGPTRSATSKPAKSYEERNADYIAALPPDLVDKAGQRQLTDIGYDVCDKLEGGQSENSMLNDLEDRDPIWFGLYNHDVVDAAKGNLCDG